MHSPRLSKFVSVVLVVVFPAAMMFAETSGAMVYAQGTVSVNGSPVSNSTSLFSGDRVDTAAASMVTINQTGSSVAMNPNSSLRYEKSDVELVRGTARVSTSNGMAARVDQLSISPKQKAAKFEVARLDNKVLVTSREGELVLSGAGKTATVEPGTAATVDLDPPAPGGGSASSGGGIPGWAIAAIAVGLAGTGVAIAALVIANNNGSGTPVSPVNP